MSVVDGVNKASVAVRKPGGGLLIFIPVLIALMGAIALYLGQLSSQASAPRSGYGIDELATAAITPVPIGDAATTP